MSKSWGHFEKQRRRKEILNDIKEGLLVILMVLIFWAGFWLVAGFAYSLK